MAMKSVYPPMALLTPPNSDKHHLADSFSSQTPGLNDPPVFSTKDHERETSPWLSPMMSGRRPRPRRRLSATEIEKIQAHKRAREQRRQSHEPEALEALLYFAKHFPPMFISWVDKVQNSALVDPIPKAAPAGSTKTSGKRKAPAIEEYSPRKRVATPTAKSRQSTTHSRKRSTLSESHLSKADSKATRMPAQKPHVSKDYRDWFDFAPSRQTLDTNQSAMTIARIDTAASNKTKDLTTDPNRDQLHDAELEVAKRLNIECGKYLMVKHAVFNGYVKHLLFKNNKRDLTAIEVKQGLKSWNKTAAQQTCSMDVNTVSKLYGKFWEKLGWFDEQYYQDYINNADAVSFPEFDREGRVTKTGGFEA